jgi:hypothetical protein
VACSLTINMAAVPGTDTVTFSIDAKDPVTGCTYPMLASAAIVAAERGVGNITLTGGAAGSINTAVVGGIALIVAPVPFNASLEPDGHRPGDGDQRAHGDHGYTANAAGAVVTITAAAGTGTTRTATS